MRQLTRYMICFLMTGSLAGTVFSQKVSLERCKEQALKNNVAIRNGALSVQAAEQTKKEAFTKYFPSVSASANTFTSSKALMEMTIKGGNLPVYDGNPANLAMATQFAYFPDANIAMLKNGSIATVSATQPLFAGGRIINGNKLANIGVEAQKLSAALSANEVILHTEQYFWQIVSLEEKLKTINQVELLLQNLQKDVDLAYKAGVVPMNDVLNVKLKRNELSGSRLKVENGIRICKMALCQYAGMTYDSTMEIDYAESDFRLISSPETYAVNPHEAVAHRTEFRLLQKNVEASRLQVRIKLGELLPEAGVGVTYTTENLLGYERHYGMAFASLKVPVSDWWGGSHAIKKRKLDEQIAINNQTNANEQMLLQIQQTWQDLKESYKQIGIAQVAVDQATENHRLNTDSYKAGTVPLSDLLSAQASLQQSKDRYVDACTDYMVKKLKYLQSTGR